MKKLKLEDFEVLRTDGLEDFYFSYSDGVNEICLEHCLGGFDVAIYGPNENLLTSKKCTDFKFKRGPMMFGLDGLSKGQQNMVILRAMKFANEFYKTFIIK